MHYMDVLGYDIDHKLQVLSAAWRAAGHPSLHTFSLRGFPRYTVDSALQRSQIDPNHSLVTFNWNGFVVYANQLYKFVQKLGNMAAPQ
ncbi:hypothetical protein BST61_g6350 [Cercospora zeina]